LLSRGSTLRPMSRASPLLSYAEMTEFYERFLTFAVITQRP